MKPGPYSLLLLLAAAVAPAQAAEGPTDRNVLERGRYLV